MDTLPDEVVDLIGEGTASAELLRPLKPSDIRCDAGELVGDSSCRCSIERTVIDGRTSPESITAFCMGEPTACPTWRKNREAEWQGLPTLAKLMEAAEHHRVEIRAQQVVKQARLAQAEELLKSDTVEGRRFRARVAAIIAAGEDRAARYG